MKKIDINPSENSILEFTYFSNEELLVSNKTLTIKNLTLHPLFFLIVSTYPMQLNASPKSYYLESFETLKLGVTLNVYDSFIPQFTNAECLFIRFYYWQVSPQQQNQFFTSQLETINQLAAQSQNGQLPVQNLAHYKYIIRKFSNIANSTATLNDNYQIQRYQFNVKVNYPPKYQDLRLQNKRGEQKTSKCIYLLECVNRPSINICKEWLLCQRQIWNQKQNKKVQEILFRESSNLESLRSISKVDRNDKAKNFMTYVLEFNKNLGKTKFMEVKTQNYFYIFYLHKVINFYHNTNTTKLRVIELQENDTHSVSRQNKKRKQRKTGSKNEQHKDSVIKSTVQEQKNTNSSNIAGSQNEQTQISNLRQIDKDQQQEDSKQKIQQGENLKQPNYKEEEAKQPIQKGDVQQNMGQSFQQELISHLQNQIKQSLGQVKNSIRPEIQYQQIQKEKVPIGQVVSQTETMTFESDQKAFQKEKSWNEVFDAPVADLVVVGKQNASFNLQEEQKIEKNKQGCVIPAVTQQHQQTQRNTDKDSQNIIQQSQDSNYSTPKDGFLQTTPPEVQSQIEKQSQQVLREQEPQQFQQFQQQPLFKDKMYQQESFQLFSPNKKPILALYYSEQQNSLYCLSQDDVTFFSVPQSTTDPKLQVKKICIPIDPIKKEDLSKKVSIVMSKNDELIFGNASYLYWVRLDKGESEWKYVQRKEIYSLALIQDLNLLLVGGRNFSKLSYFGKQTSRSNIKVYSCGQEGKSHLYTYDIPLQQPNEMIGVVQQLRQVIVPPNNTKMVLAYTHHGQDKRMFYFLKVKAFNHIEVYGKFNLTDIGLQQISQIVCNPHTQKVYILEQVSPQSSSLKRLKIKLNYNKVQVSIQGSKIQFGRYERVFCGGKKGSEWYGLVSRAGKVLSLYRYKHHQKAHQDTRKQNPSINQEKTHYSLVDFSKVQRPTIQHFQLNGEEILWGAPTNFEDSVVIQTQSKVILKKKIYYSEYI